MKKDNTRSSLYQEQIVAANIDIGVIVASVKDPRFYAPLIEKYLIIMQNGNVKPIICLSKSDLTEKRDPIIEYYKNDLGIDVIEISTITKKGFNDLQDILKKKIAVFVGNSGVGKTSIINMLNKNLSLKTEVINSKYKEGRHTTTKTCLYEWEKESYIIDTPGIRSLEVVQIEKENLKYFFPEFEQYKNACKYTDCSHNHESENDCAIKKAITNNTINIIRYKSYLRILKSIS
jgi:ribosome biogenesis GTPase / thiamine phosphate phosphatase